MELKGKPLSLESKIFAGVFVLLAWLLNAIFGWGVATWDIIQVGLFIALIFAPVDISLIAEKFGKRQG